MFNYGLDYNKLVNWLTPSPIRKPAMIGWLRALVSPLQVLHSTFLLFQERTYQEVVTTGQVTVLRNALNDAFDIALRRIYISDAPQSSIIYIFTEAENQPVYLPKFISGSATDFIVYAPIALKGFTTQITAFVNKYKLAGKRWQLIFY